MFTRHVKMIEAGRLTLARTLPDGPYISLQ